MSRKKVIRFFFSVMGLAFLSVIIAESFVYFSSTMVRSPLEGLENQIVDLGFQARLKNKNHNKVTTDDIVIIDIDDASIERLGRPQLWPRAYDAYVISYVASGLPRSIGIDYLYTEPDTLSPAYADILEARGYSGTRDILRAMSTDPELAMSIADAGNVYLALFDDDSKDAEPVSEQSLESLRLIDAGNDTNFKFHRINYPVLPIQAFSESARAVGTIDMSTAQDGTVRNYRLLQQVNCSLPGKHLIGNFPFYMAIDALGIADSTLHLEGNKLVLSDSMYVPLRKNGSFRINWLGREDSIRYIPYHKVLSGRMPAEFFENKFVFFGTSASGMQDLKTVPSGIELIPGAEVHAIAFLNMMNNAFIREVSEREAIPYFVAMALLFVAVFLLIRPLLGFVLAVLLVFGEMFFFIIWYLPEQQTVFPIVTMMLLTFFCYILSSLYIYFIRERKSRRLKMAFGSYVSPDVVDKISKDSSSLHLGGEKKELTVLFSDIRGFTSYSEKLDPEAIVAVLNDYLSEMSECIFRQRGTIDKFIGDAIMSIFGAPVPQLDHADRACRVALDMIATLKEFNERHAIKGHSPLAIGIGLNTGAMTVGNIGSQKRFDYTVIGDEVNLGSRLEGLTKYFGVNIIVSEATMKACTTKEFLFRPLANVVVKGKDNPVQIFQLLGKVGEINSIAQDLETWQRALDAYAIGDLTHALSFFHAYKETHPRDAPSTFYIDRCNEAMDNPLKFSATVIMDSK